MDRSKNLQSVWPYLPAFRAVAEEEHLPRAAARLHVVPSALSRSVRLLEELYGAPLFERRGRRLVLNARGRALLERVQQGMRSLERGLEAPRAESFAGELRVGTIGVLTNQVVLPELLALTRDHPALVPAMSNAGPKEAGHRLLLGSLDVAFCYDAIPLEGVRCVRLGALTASVYCGPGHALFKRKQLSERELLAHPFSVPAIGDRNVPMDGWPVHKARRVGFHIELLLTNLEVALTGRFLTVLPDIVAAPHLEEKRLRRFPHQLVPEIEVYGLWREGEDDAPVIAALVRAVRARVEASSTTARRGSPRRGPRPLGPRGRR